ncbi:MAG: cell surface protein, partial [Acidobacteria bacterium]
SPFQAAIAGNDDAFVTKLNATGSALVYSTYLGGSTDDFGIGIAVDSAGNAYVAGRTNSTNFPTASPFQAAFGGNLDAFVTKLNATGS